MRDLRSTRPLATALLLGALVFAHLPIELRAQAPESTTRTLLDKAHALEVRGRMDMAAQTWQQVLLADPNNTEALAGLARSAKLSGNPALANTYLDRLRAINPSDPNIGRVESTATQTNQTAQLQQAAKYAQAGQFAQAMKIYRQIFGDMPPRGDWALAYYETEAATEDGRPQAIAALRSLARQYPEDTRYQIALGRVLTYSPETRAEGRKLLEQHPNDPHAVEALRQSLTWDANPASAADIRANLSRSGEPQIIPPVANPNPGPAQATVQAATPTQTSAERQRATQEQAAFNALNTKQLDEAERRFKLILAGEPKNARALAGMGYVRLQQSNFTDALNYLEQARLNGARDSSLDAALTDAHFGVILGEANAALAESNLPTAEQKYQAALALRPGSPEALEGLGNTLLKAQQPKAAAEVFGLYVKVKPTAPAAWRGLFLSQCGAGNAPGALSTESSTPAAIHEQLMRDPEYLRTLASAYSAVGRDADALSVLSAALALPFSAEEHGLQLETQLQYANLLLQANHLDQAAGIYKQILAADTTNTPAWEGLIRAEHALKQDDHALQTLQAMPPSNYQVAMRDPGFQVTVAAIYQSEKKLDIAQDILEKSLAEQQQANQKPSPAVLLQLAGVYVARNNPQRAFPLYQQLLAANPDRADAWKGLIVVLHATGHDQEVITQVQQIPQPVRKQLEDDVEYLQTIAAVYNSLGQPRDAMAFIDRVQQHYATQRTAAPADVDVQEAWLLFNGGNDAGLYRQLMILGGRQDLTDDQRRSVQAIWINWSVRRANQAAAAGNTSRSLAILNAASHVFPDNPGVIRALAAAYLRAGLPKQAVLIFKAQDMTAGSASDYKAAVGAALATEDSKDAETWLRYGLESYSRDAGMLTLAARFEESRGNDSRAADYFRASLAAMPAGDPGADLAYELSQPLPVVQLPNAAQDLANLLSTDSDAQSKRPYLPSYNNNVPPPIERPAPNQVNGPYDGSSSIVPSYMANHGSRVAEPPTVAATLKNYVSQPQDPQSHDQRQRLTLQPQEATPHLTAVSHEVPHEEVYGPYVPYVPPQQNTGYAPTPVAVQLGDKTPRTAPAQREVTDVLLTARYMGSAHPGGSGVKHPDFSAAPNPQTPSKVASSMAPPSDTTLTLHNAQYSTLPRSQQQYDQTNQEFNQGFGQQYPQPMKGPSGGTESGASGTHPAKHRRNPGTSAKSPAASTSSQAATTQPSTQVQTGVSTPSTAAATTTQPALPPLSYPNVAPPSTVTLPSAAESVPSSSKPPSDADLLAKSVPPLAGPFAPGAGIVPGAPLTPRQKTELELAALEASYSGWVGGTGIGRYRNGTRGFDRLNDLEAPFEASALLGKTLRATVVPIPVFLSSGNIDTAFYQKYSGTIPVLGTLPANVINPPKQQTSSGVGGEFQITTANTGLAVGYTPYGFLVTNITARGQWRPFGNHFTFYGSRDSVKDTQLSYAGLRDPGTASAIYGGNIWGGVIATGGGARFDIGSERANLYVYGAGANLTGYHVLENRKYEGTMAASFRVKRWPGHGSLSIGANFAGMHYDYNEQGMTYGQGGYFSPNLYFLATVPITYRGYYKNNFHYYISGSVGARTFQEDQAPYYPLDLGLETDSGNAMYPYVSQTSFNYTFNSEASYRIAEHWYMGAFVYANNTYNYDNVVGGFYVRYLFKAQYPTESAPTGIFPTSGFRPIRVP